MAAQLTQTGLSPKFIVRSRVSPQQAQGPATLQRSWIDRLLRRREPTVYHRCLAVHIHHAGPRSALS
ncbi:MAG: hypothetical protein JWL84_4543 [Rhodospirillales bacterium]|jgi:hypothetical protein|nr:hypothetical protein [Rhodospirillales bacterium]